MTLELNEHEALFWALHGQLESALREPFQPAYRERVAAARVWVKANSRRAS
jgi:hypothetical protein